MPHKPQPPIAQAGIFQTAAIEIFPGRIKAARVKAGTSL
jgi:hypothetical protein